MNIKNNKNPKPLYKIEVKAFQCSFEIEVNDIPCFSYYDEPQIATDIPINNLVFSSGKQFVRLQLIPLSNQNFFSKDCKIELKIYTKEANDFYLKKVVIKSYSIAESLEGKSYFENIFEFDASVPYKIDTTLIKYNFSYDDKDELFSELYTQYQVLSQFINDDELMNYNKFTEIRFKDFAVAHYLSEDKKKYFLNKALFTYKNYNLKLVPQNEYNLKFCFDNKLVYLTKPKMSPGIILEDENSNEEGLHFIESAIFFRNENQELELFR